METARTALRWLLGLGLVAAGANHFRDPAFYVSIMPPYLPWPLVLVWISGVAEIALGVAALVPRTRRWAGWGIVLLLVAVFPANLHMALHPQDYGPAWALYARLPLQLLFIVWAWWATRDPTSSAAADEA